MKQLLLLLLIGILAGCHPAEQPAQPNWSRTLSTTEQFAQAQPDTLLQFPADHGAHPTFGIEWWYLTATLHDEQGRPFGIQWTLFRRAFSPEAQSGWQTPQLFMAHAALSDNTHHYFAQKYARGGVQQAGVTASPFAAWIDHWQLASDSPARYPMQVSASSGEFSYQLTLTNPQVPYLQGNMGFSQKHGSGVGSYYYSEPFIQAKGVVQIGEQRISVAGHAWLDHEWSSQFLSAQQQGWDWFALALDENTRLMLFQLREEGGNHFRYARIMHRDGTQSPIAPEHITLTPQRYTQSAGRTLPEQWQITIPATNSTAAINLLVSMHHPDQWMATDFPYWEGMVTFTGSHNGRGYLEMTGYE